MTVVYIRMQSLYHHLLIAVRNPPAFISHTSSAICRSISVSCETTRTEALLSFTDLSVLHRAAMLGRSIPAVGSSSRSTDGFLSSWTAIATLLWYPPLSSDNFWSSCKWLRPQISSTACSLVTNSDLTSILSECRHPKLSSSMIVLPTKYLSGNWKTTPTSFTSLSRATSFPAKPASTFSRVDFPEPLGP